MNKIYITRMHSSRMRTGCALTISGVGGVHPRRIFLGEKKLKKKEKKFGGPPQKFQTPLKISDSPSPLRKFQTPPKISDPPKNFRPPPDQARYPPQKFQTPLGPGHSPCGQTDACKLITLAQLRCGRKQGGLHKISRSQVFRLQRFHRYRSRNIAQIRKETTNTWEYKVGNNANIAYFVRL